MCEIFSNRGDNQSLPKIFTGADHKRNLFPACMTILNSQTKAGILHNHIVCISNLGTVCGFISSRNMRDPPTQNLNSHILIKGHLASRHFKNSSSDLHFCISHDCFSYCLISGAQYLIPADLKRRGLFWITNYKAFSSSLAGSKARWLRREHGKEEMALGIAAGNRKTN